ncbi:uncharacterized protein UHOD_07957 [Ustilago sp. UG-2017b]|nr:uncharacterized protein UHOD_07957 [Ustilago sp. UG-2017b]
MTIMDGEDMQRLWSLIEDLTNQLQANRQLCESLQQQADQLRGQAIHSGTGFALRRFNTDLSKEKFESELEALNAHLVKENLSLSHENKQQAVLLREYENTLETVMAKFRSFSHSTQQHTLQLTQHYESLLAQTTHNAAEQTLAAETAFSGTLTHLGGMVRRALQSLDGEVSDDDEEEEEGEGDGSGSGRKRKSKRGWVQDPKWYGSGGYTGKTTDPVALCADEALEQLAEEERLRMENDTLRELLGLKEKSDALLSAGRAGGLVQADVNAAAAAPKPMSPAERRASLTVDEAAIAAEASGQPPYKALSISSTTRPGEESSVESATSPARASPKFTSALERKDQIIEEAISAEDENNAGRGRQAGETSLIVEAAADGEASTNTAALPFVFAADDAEEAPSSIEELRASAAAKQENGETTQVHATLPDTTGAATDADEITPIDEVDVPSLAEPASSAESNLLAEASPPALVSTGIEDSDAKTTVTSASGIDVAESTGAAPSPTQTRSAASTASSSSSSSPSLSAGTSETSISVVETEAKEEAEAAAAPPTDSAEGDFAPVVSEPSAAAAETKEAVLPAEPAKADNASVSPEAVVLADAKGTTTPVSSTEGKEKAGAAAAPVKETRAPSTPNQGGGGKKDGQASPAKKGGRGHRGKGNRHNKSNSSASNKSGF